MSATVIDIDYKEVNVTDDDPDNEVPRRKPIGWNYQNVFPSKAEKQVPVNGNHIDSETVDVDSETVEIDSETVDTDPETFDTDPETVDIDSETVNIDSKPADTDSETVELDPETVDINSETVGRLDNTLSDDIEVLEVKECHTKSNRKLKFLLPPSSSRKEIKNTLRTAVQTSIVNYFKNEPKVKFGRPLKKEAKYRSQEKSSMRFERTIKKESAENPLEESSVKFQRPNKNEPKDSIQVEKSSEKSERLDKNKPKDITLKQYEKNELKNSTQELLDRNKLEDSTLEQSSAKCGKSINPNQSNSPNLENKDGNVNENGHIDAKSLSGPSGSKEKEVSVKEISDEDSRLVVEKFIEKWKSLGTFGHDERKIENRLWKHYNACHPTYTRSRKFINAIDRGTNNLTLDNILKFLTSIIKHLKEYKNDPYKEKKKKLESKPEDMEETAKTGEEAKEEEEVLDEAQLKKQRKLQRIEKAMKQLMEKINKYETAEVDWDDEDNSSYLILDRLKRKFGELDALYCKTAECSVATGRPIEKKFRFEGSRYSEINKRIEAWVNKNRTFPDYVDILNLVKKVSKQNSLPMKPAFLRKMAEDIFREVGRVLKERREKDDFYCIYAYADGNVEMDPADIDPGLGEKLSHNEVEAKDNLDKVFKFYEDQEAEVIEDNREQAANRKKMKNEKEECKDISDQNDKNKEKCKDISDKNDKNKEEHNDISDKNKEKPTGEKSTEQLEVLDNDIEEVDEEEEEEEEEDNFDDTDGIEEDNNDDYDDDEDDGDDDGLQIIETPPVNLPQPEDTDSRFDESDDDIKEILAYDDPINDYDDEDSEDPFSRNTEISESPVLFEPEEIEIDEALPKPGFSSSFSYDKTLPKPGFSPPSFGFKRRFSSDMVEKIHPMKRMKDDTEVVEID